MRLGEEVEVRLFRPSTWHLIPWCWGCAGACPGQKSC